LNAFYIDKDEVTNAEYAKFTDDAGHAAPPSSAWDGRKLRRGMEDHPVTHVSLEDAAAFAAWAGKRLPTEAEWEKACRGTDARIYPWGSQPPPSSKLLNFLDSALGSVTDVGSYPEGASPYGLRDMAGNVWEWTSSLYRDYPYKADDGREDPNSIALRVLRGGSFGAVAQDVRCASRGGNGPLDRLDAFGFRVVSPGF
jgi:formylglycine-generating enzyme required for sulfatase activity